MKKRLFKKSENNMKKSIVTVLAVSFLFTLLTVQSASARFYSPSSGASVLADSQEQATRGTIATEGAKAFSGENQRIFEMPAASEKQKVVLKPREMSIKQHLWITYSYPDPSYNVR